MFPFDKILTYIANEHCALVVGPEIMRFGGKPMNMYLRDTLFQQYETEVEHYYAQDGLFLFPRSGRIGEIGCGPVPAQGMCALAQHAGL